MLNEKNRISVKQFVKKNNKKFIVIYGPTGCGKTSFSLEVAHFLKQEGYEPFIISTDSRQIYQEMNIGTGKISSNEMQGIPHIGLDIIRPDETFSVVDFQKFIHNCPFFKKWLSGNSQQIPIICGGTGLYIDSLIFERNYLGNEPSQKRRKELEKYRQEFGNEALWKKLHTIDPKYAKELHPNNHTYIIRAIEIFEETGKSKKEAEQPLTLKYPTLFLTPYNDENRQELYEKINTRILQMIDEGLIDEINDIRKKYGDNCPGLKTIDYKEIMNYLQGKISLEKAIESMQQHNRNYAKRQISWNKKYIPFL